MQEPLLSFVLVAASAHSSHPNKLAKLDLAVDEEGVLRVHCGPASVQAVREVINRISDGAIHAEHARNRFALLQDLLLNLVGMYTQKRKFAVPSRDPTHLWRARRWATSRRSKRPPKLRAAAVANVRPPTPGSAAAAIVRHRRLLPAGELGAIPEPTVPECGGA
jgi:hypothetical protein